MTWHTTIGSFVPTTFLETADPIYPREMRVFHHSIMEESFLCCDAELPHPFDAVECPFEFYHGNSPGPETEEEEVEKESPIPIVLPIPDEIHIAGNFVSQYLNPVILQERAIVRRHDVYVAKCREEKKIPRHIPGMAAHRFTLRLLEKFCMEYCTHASFSFCADDQEKALQDLVVNAAPCVYHSNLATVRTGLGPVSTAALFCTELNDN